MIRILIFLAVIILAALGLGWLADRPGDIVLTWQGTRVEFSLMTGIAGVLLVGVAMIALWSLLRILFRLPGIVALSGRARRRARGFAAISRGLIAVGSGDARAAERSATEARRLLGDESMTLLLSAQAAQLSGDRPGAEAAFSRMLDRDETRVLGLRGLFLEARRKGDESAARFYADEAHKLAPGVAWVGGAVLDYRLREQDWTGAATLLEQNTARRLVDRPTARRQRAALLAAAALATRAHDPDGALAGAQAALKLDPGLVPAAVLAGRRLAEKGDSSRAARLLETAWKRGPHPDIADAYLDVRPGDSALDRLARARTLLKLAPGDIEGRLAVARAAMDAREFAAAREALEPLLATPTVRTCLLMAEIEERDGGAAGAVRQWLARASRAPRDRAWVADGQAQDAWAPYAPHSGEVGAFRWQEPAQSPAGPAIGFEVEALHAEEPAAPPLVLAAGEAVPEFRNPEPESTPVPVATTEAASPPPATRESAALAAPAAEPVLIPPAAPRATPRPVVETLVTPPLPDDPGPEPVADGAARRSFRLFS